MTIMIKKVGVQTGQFVSFLDSKGQFDPLSIKNQALWTFSNLDNKFEVQLAKNPFMHKRTKHIDFR